MSNGLNQLATVGGVSAAYDSNGNLATDPASAKTYSYDSQNELKTTSGGVSLYYDPVGRLAEYDTNVSSRFMSDGSEVTVEVDNPGSNIVRRWVRGDGPDELIAWYEGTGTTNRRFAGLDERNSVISATDASGTLVGINKYDEYGIPASGNVGRMQYTGQMWLPEAGVTYHKARNLLPTAGLFAQTDPNGPQDDPNLYPYTGNDPVNYVDPLGLDPFVCPPSTNDKIFACGRRPPCPANTRCIGNPQGAGYTNEPVPPRLPIGHGRDTDTDGEIVVIGKRLPSARNLTRPVSLCMQEFLASQGYSSPNLASVVFYRGDRGSRIARTAFTAFGNPAITVHNNIYVKPGHWGQFLPGSSGYFEEIIHSEQWYQSGSVDFATSWLFGSAGGWLLSGDLHDSPLENEAIIIANNLAAAYQASHTVCP